MKNRNSRAAAPFITFWDIDAYATAVGAIVDHWKSFFAHRAAGGTPELKHFEGTEHPVPHDYKGKS